MHKTLVIVWLITYLQNILQLSFVGSFYVVGRKQIVYSAYANIRHCRCHPLMIDPDVDGTDVELHVHVQVAASVSTSAGRSTEASSVFLVVSTSFMRHVPSEMFRKCLTN